ncbi:MAG: hypothetical protein IPP07_06030 [Holophagales bacterium]|nr:hypothetical protein [Holophagales bacterium]
MTNASQRAPRRGCQVARAASALEVPIAFVSRLLTGKVEPGGRSPEARSAASVAS